MPTKHKRKRSPTTDKSHYDLPPSTRARSLPVIAPTKDFLAPSSRKKQKLNPDDGSAAAGKKKRVKKSTDDTPKAFARLMAWHKEGRKIGGGLDEGVVVSQKKKKETQARKVREAEKARKQEGPGEIADSAEPRKEDAAVKTTGVPKIQPGETLAQYGLRIDQALPLSSLAKSNVNANSSLPADLREKEKKAQKLTKHNKRLARMQTEWRNTEAKLRSREEEEAEENVEKIEEEKLLWDGVKITGKKGKKKVVEDDDPWKELERKRRMEQGKGKREAPALTARDHAQAPPEFVVKKLNPFKEMAKRTGGEVGGIAQAAGGEKPWKKKDKRRLELDTIRRNHIEATKRSMQGGGLRVSV